MTQDTSALEALDALVADADQHARRVGALKLNDNQKREFALLEAKNNVWPWLADFARTVREGLADHDDAIEEILSTEESVIQPELAAQIFNYILMGRALAAKIRGLRLSDVTKKDLAGALDEFEKHGAIVETAVGAVAVELEGPEDEETDDDDEDEDTEDEEDDLTPEEAEPVPDDNGEPTVPGGEVA